jgi:lantibiotic leader peptide-processing serine protease
MKYLKLVLALGVEIATLAAANPDAQQASLGAASERLIVVFKSSTLPTDADEIIAASGGNIVSKLPDVGVVVAEGGAQLRGELLSNPAVLDVGSDWVMSNDDHQVHPLPTFSPALPPDFLYTSTPQQWHSKRIGAAGGGVPTRPGDPTSGAWGVTFGRGVKIAIIDTGINPVHPDLAREIVLSRAMSHPTPLLGDVECEVPDPSNPSFDSPVDQSGHGSWTASLAAASLGGGLTIGVAPEAQLLNIKVLRRVPAPRAELDAAGIPATAYYRCLFSGQSRGLASWVFEGMLLASAEGADVISMSLGALIPRAPFQSPEPAVIRAMQRVANHVTAHGALIVAAAMNMGLDVDEIGPYRVIPADVPNVLAVMATTNPQCVETATPLEPCVPGPDALASYSNHGSRLNGLAAPGGAFPFGFCAFNGVPCFETGMVVGACAAGIPGTVPPAPDTYPIAGPPPPGTSFGCASFPYPPGSLVPFPGFGQHMWYRPGTGTSAATPLVAGAAALVKAARPDLDPQQIRSILQNTAEDLGKPGYDDVFNFGLVDAAAAVTRAVR